MQLSKSTPTNTHAVVIGGSMAGLLAGRVLADHFDRVTIIEKGYFPEKPSFRPGVPQSPHLHFLLMQGRIILDKLFPGFTEDLMAAGAQLLDMTADVAWLKPFGWAVRFPSDFNILSLSRSLLDWYIHKRLLALKLVNFLEGGSVTGLLSQNDGIVTGVSVRIRDRSSPENSRQEEIRADLVVDASGRNSKTPQWLESLGYQAPKEALVNAHPGYASCTYQIPSGFKADWKAVYLQGSPPKQPRAAILYPIEGDRWIVSTMSIAPDYPPGDEAGFLEFLSKLESPILYDTLKNAQPLSPVVTYRPSGNRRRYYEQLPKQPEGFIVTGDSVCTFSPVYGQGVTVSALEAITLGQCLQNGLAGVERRFQKELGKVVTGPWLAATTQDARYDGVEGKSLTFKEHLLQGYMDRVDELATTNPDICLKLFDVIHMIKSPDSLLEPALAMRVLMQALGNFRFEKGSLQEKQG
ncbi:MAG: hypothetical protein WBG70_20685 [Spirulinaceae cyanobacterium]